MAEIQADIAALKAFRDALIRFRLAQRDVIARGNQEIEKTRASLEAKAKLWQRNLEQRRGALDACLHAAAAAAGPYGGGGPGYPRGGGGYAPDCSRQARAVQEAEERLKHIRTWQRKVDQEAEAFRDKASRFQNLVDHEVPRAESHLLAIASGLEAARGLQVSGS